jgi:hypothetical protein
MRSNKTEIPTHTHTTTTTTAKTKPDTDTPMGTRGKQLDMHRTLPTVDPRRQQLRQRARRQTCCPGSRHTQPRRPSAAARPRDTACRAAAHSTRRGTVTTQAVAAVNADSGRTSPMCDGSFGMSIASSSTCARHLFRSASMMSDASTMRASLAITTADAATHAPATQRHTHARMWATHSEAVAYQVRV